MDVVTGCDIALYSIDFAEYSPYDEHTELLDPRLFYGPPLLLIFRCGDAIAP